MRRAPVLISLVVACLSLLAVAEASSGVDSPQEPGTVVAVLDTGVSAELPELAGRVLPGVDLVDGDTDPDDDNNHGSAVAANVVAACPGCQILPVRVLSTAGAATWSRVAAGVLWAVDHGARVINISIAGTDGSNVLRAAIAYAAAHDVLVVAAAGNTGDDEPQYPAAYEGVLGVAAAGVDGRLYDWSSRGATVDLALPGCARLPMVLGTHAWACGTSFAAPFAAGTAGLARGADPTATAVTIAKQLPSFLRLPATPTGSVRVSGSPTPGTTVKAAVVGLDRNLGERVLWFRCAAAATAHACVAASDGPTYRVRAADSGSTLVARVVTEPFGGLWLASSARLPVS